jgi:hypothetical protein
MVAMLPMKANQRRNVLRNLPWSAAPLMLMIKRAWIRTEMLNVYMAKLAVLISTPRMWTTHCPFSGFGLMSASMALAEKEGVATGRGALHGVVRSERRTPFSRASCSSVTGMKEPIPQTTKTLRSVSYGWSWCCC